MVEGVHIETDFRMARSQPREKSEVLRGVAAALPVALGVVPASLVLGAQATRIGFTVLDVPALTGLNFAGGSEFAALGLWTWPPHILLIGMVTFLVNSRHILMGAALSKYLKHLPKRVVLPALFFMCDESWALGFIDAKSESGPGKERGFSVVYYFGVCAVLYATWVGFTTLGGLIGPNLGDFKRYGLDLAFPATFLVLLRGLWKGPVAARPWLVSFVVAAVTYKYAPEGWYVAVGALSGLFASYFQTRSSHVSS